MPTRLLPSGVLSPAAESLSVPPGTFKKETASISLRFAWMASAGTIVKACAAHASGKIHSPPDA